MSEGSLKPAPATGGGLPVPALSLAFFDPEGGRHGQLRSGVSVLFEGGEAKVEPGLGGPVREDGAFRAQLGEGLELDFTPLGEAIDLGVARTHVCAVKGTAAGARVDCLGTATETPDPPAWAELDGMRALCALFDREHALLAVASRPLGAAGHGEEAVRAVLVDGGVQRAAEEARISTVYDEAGRQQSVGVELFMPGEELPRRVFGAVAAGASLELDGGLRVQVAVFTWRMEGREGTGAYDLTLREQPPAAA